MQDNEITRKTWSVPEAAKILGVGLSCAYTAAKRGDLPTVKIGGRILVPAAALEDLLMAKAVVTLERVLEGK